MSPLDLDLAHLFVPDTHPGRDKVSVKKDFAYFDDLIGIVYVLLEVGG